MFHAVSAFAAQHHLLRYSIVMVLLAAWVGGFSLAMCRAADATKAGGNA